MQWSMLMWQLIRRWVVEGSIGMRVVEGSIGRWVVERWIGMRVVEGPIGRWVVEGSIGRWVTIEAWVVERQECFALTIEELSGLVQESSFLSPADLCTRVVINM